MTTKKLFESDISLTLKKIGCYYYKPPDIMQAGQDKVDFFLNYFGHFVAIEAKEVPGLSCLPSAFSPGQKLCLARVARSGGLAVVVVNYGRKKDKGGRGKAAAFHITTDWWLPMRYEEGLVLEPEEGSTWSLMGALDHWLSR